MTISDTGQHDDMTSQPAITFYGKMLTFSRLQLRTNDLTAIEAHLSDMLSNKSSQIPVIIDSSVEQDLSALIELLWTWGLQPIGVVTGLLDRQAQAQRLAIFPADGKRIERIVSSKKSITQLSQTSAEKAAKAQTKESSAADTANSEDPNTVNKDPNTIDVSAETLLSSEHITSMIYDQLLRSGQSINHVGGDLILTNSVNSGAEAITDNSLHVYGRAQGRLVAGATGDKDARIFCQVFNPSLVSVAGTYCLRDNLPENTIDKPVQVRFVEGEGLVFTVMEST
ncbi:septum site-determining protein MinC [Psychrobacter sp. FBL11]|uniref:Probable septum site-determining protein MinC n=1 Tax=Psychrobacter saeujeotis TaxID=3143436 RepID=A0ABU9X402_9GAMM|nr:septum site-determining protein MinC [uncultured Psychrobacter sp.]